MCPGASGTPKPGKALLDPPWGTRGVAEATGLALPLPCVLLWCCHRGLALGLAPGIPSLVRWLRGAEGWQRQGPPSLVRIVLVN